MYFLGARNSQTVALGSQGAVQSALVVAFVFLPLALEAAPTN